MRFLLDANLSPKLVEVLSAAGYPARHVVEIGLVGAPDLEAGAVVSLSPTRLAVRRLPII